MADQNSPEIRQPLEDLAEAERLAEEARAEAERAENARARDEQRRQKREAEAAYKAAALAAADMLTAYRAEQRLDTEQLLQLQSDVLGMFYNFDSSLLLEQMLLIRLDDSYYHHHAVNVALLNALAGSMLNLDAPVIERLVKIGLVIDLGMLQLPAQILDRSYKASDFDKVRIRQHTQATIRMLKASGESDEAFLNAVLCHHERYNGTGYPLRLKGEEIPLEARITAVSDSFDAAVAKRSYDRAKSPFEIIAELAQNPNDALDPKITHTVTMGLAAMLTGCYVVLNDRSTGQVVQIDPDNFAFPLVKVLGRLVQTDKYRYPISLSAYMPLG